MYINKKEFNSQIFFLLYFKLLLIDVDCLFSNIKIVNIKLQSMYIIGIESYNIVVNHIHELFDIINWNYSNKIEIIHYHYYYLITLEYMLMNYYLQLISFLILLKYKLMI